MGESTETLFDKFDILTCLKKDAGAAVYLANHIYLGKKILLKTLDRDKISDLAMLSRFQREAKTLAKLDHPNIIKVLDFGMHKNFFYISFEFFESRTLRDVITADDLSDDEKQQVLVQLLRGLDYAHARQVIHRDIKPENILLDEHNVLKIADFGLAHMHGDESFTQQTTIVGTPSYMSPEQIGGQELKAQSDLFSAGIVAYELFTGENPFLGNDVGATLNNIFTKDVELKKDQCADESIQTLINQLLKKNESDRIRSAKEALYLFGEKSDAPVVKSDADKAPVRHRGAIIGAALLFVLVVLVLVWMTSQQKEAEPERIQQNNFTDSVAVLASQDSTLTVQERAPSQPVENATEQPAIQELTEELETATEPGRLHINCLPWAYVWINGDSVNTTPLSEALSLPSGNYEIRLEHPSYPVYVQNIRIEPEKDVHISATLYSYLSCNIYPWGEVYVDGESFGQTPFAEAAIIAPGEHVLVVKNQRHGEITKDFTIAAGDTFFFRFNFEQDSN